MEGKRESGVAQCLVVVAQMQLVLSNAIIHLLWKIITLNGMLKTDRAGMYVRVVCPKVFQFNLVVYLAGGIGIETGNYASWLFS